LRDYGAFIYQGRTRWVRALFHGFHFIRQIARRFPRWRPA
jgi:hypothetical protein